MKQIGRPGSTVIPPPTSGGFDLKYQKTCFECNRVMAHRVATSNSPIWANQHRWECRKDRGGCGAVDAWVEPLESMASLPKSEDDRPGTFDTIMRRGPSLVDPAHGNPKEDAFGTALPTEKSGGAIAESSFGFPEVEGGVVGESEEEEEDPLFAEASKSQGKLGEP